MSIDVIVPALGESVSEATIAKWFKQSGDQVKTDELLLELETEKVTLEVNATTNGVIESIIANEDETVKVGQVIAKIKEVSISNSEEPNKNTQTPVQTKKGNNQIFDKKLDPITTMPPSVQKLISENNLNAKDISGTGRDGRINKSDVLEILNAPLPYDSSKSVTNNISDDNKPIERVRMSPLRKTIAHRLKESQNTAAILSTFNEIDMSNVISIRKKYRDSFQEKHNVKLGFMSFFTKAVISALKEVPSINAQMDGDDIIYKHYYDIGVAVGTNNGLVVPVVKNADKMSFSEIEKEISSLATRAREGKLSISDLTDATFSITNGGVYGSLLSTPIINPPQTGIIGLHNMQERPIAVDGKVEIRPMMYVALSYDHRVIDGKDAVMFLVKVKESIENPERLLLNI